MPAQMITLVAYIANNVWFKITYIITLTTQTLFLFQESISANERLLDVFLSNTPAKVLYGFSIIYLLSKIADAFSSSWKKFRINQIEIRMAEEDLETKEIHNRKQLKDLEDETTN